MTLAQKILTQVESLPEPYQAEVLDFVEFLEHKAKKHPAATDEERVEWSQFALAQAFRGMEDDEDVYSIEDVREAV